MSTISSALPSALGNGNGNGVAGVPTEPIWRLSVERYHEMIRQGILTADDPVELLEGWLVYQMPKNTPHTLSTQSLRDLLGNYAGTEWFVNVQEPITTDTSEPEPDVTIVRGQRRHYLEHHPGPRDLALLVEVADTSLTRDRGLKKQLYARCGIPVYWIVNLVENQLEVYTEPSGPTEQPDYRQRHDFAADDQVAVVIDGREVGRLTVRDFLP